MKNKVKIAVAAPKIRLCDPSYNVKIFIEAAREADSKGADIILFPELALTGATAGDLYFGETLIEAAKEALCEYVKETASLGIMSFVGLPISVDSYLYNGVCAVSEGEMLGITASGAKSRWFDHISDAGCSAVINGKKIQVARDLIYTDDSTRANIFVKIGEDNAFSSDGVNLILNPSAVAEYIGLAEIRRSYAKDVSSLFGIPFVIAGAGEGESGTDGIYAGARLVCDAGGVVVESELFDPDILYADVDITKKKPIAAQNIAEQDEAVLKHPFVPSDPCMLSEACELALELQSRALALRIERSYSKAAVIGVSGGLDSTLAVLVAARAMDILGRERKDVIAITMPCFGTTERTKGNALALAEELGCSVRTIDIKAAVNQHLKDISHAEGQYDVVYENAQARERTQILMDVANAVGGLVVGTGDLSELALGFATYNGDHMSMYSVNASVPKTLMRKIIAHAANTAQGAGQQRLASVLFDVIDTPVSPELLPLTDGENLQHTESIVGPYELHDFFLYYTVKYGYAPSRVFEMAKEAFPEYEPGEIKKYLEVFIRRFYSQQFKRSCMPDGPRVTEISLSPRAAWHMPSDVSANLWREDLNNIKI